MANRYAVATGNWSNTATWDGGTLPQAGDVVRPNAFTVTIDQDITVGSLRNDASSPAVAGGSFVITATTTRTLTCGFESTGSAGLLLRLQSTGIVNLIGAVTNTGNSSGSASAAIIIEANCTVNHTGNATGGSNVAGYAVSCSAIKIINTCTFNGVGTYTGGSGYEGTTYAANPAIEVTPGAGVVTLNITGNLNAGTAILTAAVIITNNNNSALNVTGIVQGSSLAPAIIAQTLGYYSVGILRQIFISGTIINVGGINAVFSSNLKISSASNVTWLFQTENALVNKTLYSANLLTGFPLVAKVESGTVYGPTNEFTGTMVPWDTAFAQALATAQSNLQLPAILGAITS
jgi:hypothetical protein